MYANAAITAFIPGIIDFIGSEAAREPDTSKGVRPVRRGLSQKPAIEIWQGVGLPPYLYTALIGYLHYEAPEEEQNFASLIEMINTMETREDDEDYQNPVDQAFEELEKEKPGHFAVRQYKKYKLAAGDVCSERLIHQYSLECWKIIVAEYFSYTEGFRHERNQNHPIVRALEPG